MCSKAKKNSKIQFTKASYQIYHFLPIFFVCERIECNMLVVLLADFGVWNRKLIGDYFRYEKFLFEYFLNI